MQWLRRLARHLAPPPTTRPPIIWAAGAAVVVRQNLRLAPRFAPLSRTGRQRIPACRLDGTTAVEHSPMRQASATVKRVASTFCRRRGILAHHGHKVSSCTLRQLVTSITDTGRAIFEPATTQGETSWLLIRLVHIIWRQALPPCSPCSCSRPPTLRRHAAVGLAAVAIEARQRLLVRSSLRHLAFRSPMGLSSRCRLVFSIRIVLALVEEVSRPLAA